MAYCDTVYADFYFQTRAFSEAWTGEQKNLYLETATQQIKDYCSFEDAEGFFIFDELDADAVIPDWLKRAVCEQALHLLNLGKDPTQADKKTTLGISNSEGTTFDKHFRADILCPNCARILENHGGILSGNATSGNSGISFGRVIR